MKQLTFEQWLKRHQLAVFREFSRFSISGGLTYVSYPVIFHEDEEKLKKEYEAQLKADKKLLEAAT